MAVVPMHTMRYLYTIRFLLGFRPIDSFLIMIYIQYVEKRGRTFIVLTFYLCLDEYANQNNIYISFSEMKGSVESDITFTI